jgi:NitT/TauT family transport system substrate-binding protein
MTVLMPFHTPFYAPVAAGAALGHFAQEGLEVEVRAAAAYGKPAVAALLDGDLVITASGLMRSFDLADRGGPVLVHFAELCQRNGFFLLARRPMPQLRWTDLVGRTVLGFAEAPTPWLCLLSVLRRNGVDPAAVRIERERPGPEAIAAFRAGHGDFLEQTQPVIEQLVDEGVGHVVAAMGEATGLLPFTSYMTTPAFLEKEGGAVAAFTRAVYRTQRWLRGRAAGEIAAALASTFPEVPAERLTRAVARYTAQDAWSHDPLIRRAGYDHLQQVLLDGGFIRAPQPYERLVDTAIAETVMREG